MNAREILRDRAYPALKAYIIERTGLEYFTDKDEDLASRLSRRTAALGVTNCAAYLDGLHDPRHGAAEMNRLVGELTIGETYFFRQREHFELLRDTILPSLIKHNAASRRLRIWSAGCATGAEPYSIAILLALDFDARLDGWDISILATDINREFLEQARTGIFAEWALRDTPRELRALCFTHSGRTWTLRPQYRTRVRFEYHNLASAEPPPGLDDKFDLILCRNVLIYFSSEVSRQVVTGFKARLTDEGWLLVGYAEPNADLFSDFETICFPDVTAYRKKRFDDTAIEPWIATAVAERLPDPVAAWVPPVPPHVPAIVSAHSAIEIMDRVAPAAAVHEARMLADSGRWHEARELVTRVIDADPLNAAAYFTLALILEHGGLADDAREAFQRTIYLDREFALAHYHLGVSHKLKRDTVTARRMFRNVLDILKDRSPGERVFEGDGMTTQELRELTEVHLELMNS